VKHPNHLYYRLQFAAEDILVHRVEIGEPEKQGLLVSSSTGKIVGQGQFGSEI